MEDNANKGNLSNLWHVRLLALAQNLLYQALDLGNLDQIIWDAHYCMAWGEWDGGRNLNKVGKVASKFLQGLWWSETNI